MKEVHGIDDVQQGSDFLRMHACDMQMQLQPMGKGDSDETSQQVRPLILFSTNSVDYVALVDTGATISCISQTAAEQMNVRCVPEERRNVKAVNGDVLKIVGKCNIIFASNNFCFCQEFVVVADLNCSVILGVDFLIKNKMSIDFVNLCIQFQHGKIFFYRNANEKQNTTHAGILSKQKLESNIRDGSSPIPSEQVNFDKTTIVGSRNLINVVDFQTLNKNSYVYFSGLPDACEFAFEVKEKCFIVNESLCMNDMQVLLALLERNVDRFSFSNNQLGRSKIVSVDIKTSDEEPVHCHPYRVSQVQREIIDKQVKEMLNLGVISESTSSYAAPVVLVKKPDDSWRFCVDYRKLNKKICRDNYPIPRIDDIVDNLAGAKYFAELDLNSGYWQTVITEGKHKTAFVTATGLYEFNVVPFGLATSQAVFQRMMDKVLGNLKFKGVMVYVDNIVVYGKTFEEFTDMLEKIFKRFREANLTFKPSKCKFGFSEIELLGYLISSLGVKPSEKKLKAMREVSAPTSAKEVKQLLGLFSYYRKFVPNFAKITLSLTKLLKKGVKFQWNEELQNSFTLIKESMCRAPILSYFSGDKSVTTRVCVDASNEAIGAVLMQGVSKMCPVAYASRKLTDAEKKYSTTEKECLALVWALKHYRHYLWGLYFQVVTDHSALCWLQSKKDMCGRLARWALAVQEWNFDIVHCSGKNNVVADFLSRNPLVEEEEQKVEKETEPSDGLEIFSINVESLQEDQANDVFCSRWIMRLNESSEMRRSGFCLRNGFLYKSVRRDGEIREVLVLPRSLFQNVMRELHDEAWTGGHLGLAKSLRRFRSRYFMPHADKEVERYLASCVPCQERKVVRNVAELMPIRVTNIFEKIGVDVLGPFPRSSRGNRFVVVSVEYASRFAICKALPRVTSDDIVRFLIEEVFCRFGDVGQIITDRGTIFTARVVRETVERFGARLIHTSAFHPQSNGLVERFNRTVVDMLSKYLGNSQREWCSVLPLVLHAYNTSVQASTKVSPYNILYGREQCSIVDRVLGLNVTGVDETVTERVDRMGRLVTKALNNITRAQVVQKRNYDRKARSRAFRVNDLVLLFVPRRVTGRCMKLTRLYQGPYKVIEVVGRSDVLIRRLNSRSRGVVVHTNRLKHFMLR